MAKTTKKDTVSQWIEKIDRAKKVKSNWRERFSIDLSYEYWEGAQRPSHIPKSEWITVNKIFADMMAELPNLYSQNPEFYVKAKQAYMAQDGTMLDARSKIREAMLNYLKDEIDLKSHSRLAIFDAQFQYGVIKVSYQVDWVKNPSAGELIMGAQGQPMVSPDGMPMTEPEKIPTNQKYVVERIHPDDFLVDEDADPLKYKWCAHKIRRKLEEVQKDKRFNAAARNKIKPTEISTEEKDRETRKKGDKVFDSAKEPEPDIVVYWEIWQPEKKEFLVVSEGCQDEFLLAPTAYPLGIEDDPFVPLRLILRDDSWYPYPPIYPKLDPQREISETRSKILTHRKRFNRKYVALETAFENAEQELAKLEVGEDGTVLRSSVQGDVIRPIQDAPLDMQVITELTFLDRDFQEYGAGASQRGSGTGIDSATEAGIIEKRFAVRESDRQSLVAEWMRTIAKKLDQLIQANLTQDMAIKVKGPEGEVWQTVRPQDYDSIMGEYDTGVVMGSHTPQLPEIERAQALNFLSLIAQSPHVAGSPALMRYLGKLFKIHDNELNLMIQELQNIVRMQQEAQMQAQMMKKGIGSMPGVQEGSRVQSATPGMALGMNNIRGGQQ